MNLPNLFFLDFDHTLFNTDVFWNNVRKACLQSHNISEAIFLETYETSKSVQTVYDIDTHLSLLNISREGMISIFASVFEQNTYVFPDVEPFLNNHSPDTIVILTQGVEWFQKTKIASVPGLKNLRTIVTDYKKRQYIEDSIGFYENGVLFEGNHYKSLTFVDNMADAFLPEEHGDVFRQYRIRRPEDAHAEEPTHKGSIEITALLDIP